MNDTHIILQLTVNETQAVLSALGKLPFESIADLWFKIKATAEQQMSAHQAQANGAGAAATEVGGAD